MGQAPSCEEDFSRASVLRDKASWEDTPDRVRIALLEKDGQRLASLRMRTAGGFTCLRCPLSPDTHIVVPVP